MDFSNITKKIIIGICILIVSLFLFTVFSNAESLTTDEFDFYIPDNVLSVYQSKPEYTSGDYYSVCFLFNNNYEMYFVPKADNPGFKFQFVGNPNYMSNGKYTRGSIHANQTMYNLHFYGGVNASLYTTSSYYWGGIDSYYQSSDVFHFWAQQDCYGSDWTTVTFPISSPSIEPIFVNAEDSNWR